ncbi:hypothetical protein ES707_15025 [subsurface metagenome]
MNVKIMNALLKNYYSQPKYVIKALRKSLRSSIRVLRATSGFRDYVNNLTNMDNKEVERYISEITSKQEFHEHIQEKLSYFDDKEFTAIEADRTLRITLYVIVRKLKPRIIVETGVSGGVSSAYILCALEENKYGKLYSIDLPFEDLPFEERKIFPPGEQSGWVIPDYLKDRWELVLGKSYEKLLPLLEELRVIDIFLHDSEHSYKNMLCEYQTVWPFLKRGGILLSDDVDSNDAFSDFCESIGVKGFQLANMGGIAKVAF